MDIRTLNRIKGVAKVTGMPVTLDDAILVYFLCPCLSSKGIMVKEDGMGYTAKFVDHLSISAKQRITKVKAFKAAAADVGWKCHTIALWCSADAPVLYSHGHFPKIPPIHDAFAYNHLSVLAHADEFQMLYQWQPWKQCPSWVVQQEERRLLSLLPPSSKDLRQDFVRRVFAGFALDGRLLRKNAFGIGHNPIIIGVESPGVGVLQNAALEPSNKIPVIQLKEEEDEKAIRTRLLAARLLT